MRAADEGGGGALVLLRPQVVEGSDDLLLLGVVVDVGLVAFGQQLAALVLGVRGQVLDVVEADRAGSGGGAAHGLQEVQVVLGDLAALEVLVDAGDEGNILHDLAPDGGAEHTPVRRLRGFHVHEPLGHAALVGHESEVGAPCPSWRRSGRCRRRCGWSGCRARNCRSSPPRTPPKPRRFPAWGHCPPL